MNRAARRRSPQPPDKMPSETRGLLTQLQVEAPASLAGVQSFVEALLKEQVTPSTVGEIVLRVHGFLCHADDHLQQAAPQTAAALAAAASDADQQFALRDALEKLLVSKIYHIVFGVGDTERDAEMHRKLSRLSHLTPAALGVGPPFGEAVVEGWGPPIDQLRRLGKHRAPKDKVMLVVNASRLIERRLNKLSRLHADTSRRHIGADEYFPVLVYAILQANPPQLLSTVTFISRFRSPEALRSLEGCYFTHFRAAVTFLESFEDDTAAEDVQRQLKDLGGHYHASADFAGRAGRGQVQESGAWHPLAATPPRADAPELARDAVYVTCIK